MPHQRHKKNHNLLKQLRININKHIDTQKKDSLQG